MHVLFFLSAIRAYQDRVRLLMEVSKGVDRLTLLIGHLDARITPPADGRFALVEAGLRPGWFPYNRWRASWLAERLIREESVDIVHDTAGFLLPLFRRKARFPSTSFLTSLYILSGWRMKHVLNRLSWFRMLSSRSLVMAWINSRIERAVCRHADGVVLQAPGLIDQLRETVSIPRDRLHVLTNSVDVDFWSPSPSGRPGPQAGEPCRLLFVGGIHSSKGAFVMVDAMRLLRERGIAATLQVVGKWSQERPAVLQRVRDYRLQDAIRFVPTMAQDALRDVYRRSDIFLYHTINDGSPRVILEALASGLPVIASHHPGIDVVDPNGEFIAFMQFGDVDEVGHWVEDFHGHRSDWEARARRGREVVVERFSTHPVARQYLALYTRIMEARSTQQSSAEKAI